MAAADATDSAGTAARLATAIKSGIFAALVALGLSVPMLLFRAEADIDNKLVLTTRGTLTAGVVIAVFFTQVLGSLLDDWRRRGLAVAGCWIAIWGVGGWVGGLFEWSGSLTRAGVGVALIVVAFIVPMRPRDATRASAGSVALAGLSRWSHLFAPAAIVALFAFPLVIAGLLGAGGSLKWINNYGIQILIYVMLGWGLNIVVGLAGLLDLGYVAFYAVGAYSYAILAKTFGLSFWLCLPLAGLLAAFWGILLGFPVLRLRGDYLAIVTLAFGEIIRIVLVNWTDFSNGYAGISSIPRITFFGVPFVDDEGSFASLFGLEYSPIHRTIFLFYLILCLALLTNFVTLRLRRLPLGRAWEALREDEIACRSLGINTVNTKLTAFALGAMFGGFAGSFFAVRQSFVSPESFTFIESATILAIVVLGGMGSQIGVAVAAVAMIGGTEILRELDFLKQIFGQDFDPTQYRMLIFGLAMVIMMIWKPRGIVSTRQPSIFLRERKSVSALLVKEGHG